MKIIKILSLFFFFSTLIFAQDSLKVQTELDSLAKEDFFKSTVLSLDIYDLTAGDTVYQLNEKKLLNPASNMKIVTTTSALLFLDTLYTFNTSVYYSGLVMDSICYGDLYVVGGGDPDFTSDDLDSLIRSIKDFGINEIRGNIYGDVSLFDSLFWGNGWMWDDDPSTDFPYMTPLIINDAAVKIAYQPSLIGQPATVSLIPNSKYFNLTNTSVTIKEDTSDLTITRDWINRSNDLIVSGTLSHNAKPDTVGINLVHPEKYFLNLTEEALRKNGIAFEGLVDTASLPVYAHHIFTFKRKFGDVIFNLNKTSDNLSAEMTLRALAYKFYGKPATAENGIKVLDSLVTLVGLDPENYRFADGSGVSRYNLVSSELLLSILKYIYKNYPDKYQILYDSFPEAGVDGTLEERMQNSFAINNVHAKTGTLSGVSALSGYLTSKNSHDIVFSIMMENFVVSARVARYFQDKICKILSGANL